MSKKKKILPILSQEASLIDTHCHLDMDAYSEDLEAVLQRACDSRIEHIISIGIDIASSKNAINLAKQYSYISATIGIHPHDVDNITTSTYDTLGELADTFRKHIVGYGEIGLDYFKEYSAADNQRQHFKNQLSLAKDLQLPVIIHDRDAHEDTLSILKSSGAKDIGGVMHCFSGDSLLAKQVIDLGFYVSIPGVVTFKNASDLQEVASTIPLDAMLIETDGPFLSPDPLRGKRNEPINVLYTAEYIAQLRGMSLDELAIQTTRNAKKLFQLPSN